MAKDTIPGVLRIINSLIPRGEIIGVRIVEKPNGENSPLRRDWKIVTTAGCDRKRKIRPIDFYYSDDACLSALQTIATFLER